jgi:hypothetical protein
MDQENVIKKAWLLSIAGLIPFLWLTIERGFNAPLLQDIFHQPAALLLTYYAAIILSFLGGIIWGFALHMHGNSMLAIWSLFYSIIPSLLGWGVLCMITAGETSIMTWIMLISGFASQLKIEASLHQLQLIPMWFWQLRCRISTVVIFTLLINCMM